MYIKLNNGNIYKGSKMLIGEIFGHVIFTIYIEHSDNTLTLSSDDIELIQDDPIDA